MNNWIKRDLEFIWHPYTQMKDGRRLLPILIERGRGVRLYDTEGNFYYDTISSWWCNVHGHNHPKIKAAIKKQMDTLEHVLFAGFTHKPAILLAEKLVSISPKGLSKVFFSDNGSTAVEVAVKMSFQYWQNKGRTKKTRFISLDKGYHGDTIGAMSLSGVELFNKVFTPLFFPSYKAPAPYCYRCPMNKDEDSCGIDCLKPLEEVLEKKSREIAAVISEPLLMAAGGMLVYPKEYLRRLATLTERFDVHLILDEVATGFGRTGRMFAAQTAGIRPDFICLSKGITSGFLPLGATLTTDKIFREFSVFYHGHTYTANPLGCAAALASLKIFDEEKTLEKTKKTIALLRRGLEDFRGLPFVGDVRHIGMVAALELVRDKKTKTSFDPKKGMGLEVYKRGLKKNLILRPLGDIIYFFLPLCVTHAQLQDILDRSRSVIKSLS